jgi:hypothetical protein
VLVLGIWAEPLVALAGQASSELLNPAAYVAAVRRGAP